MVKTLDEIALLHGTDKSSASHNYCAAVYEGMLAPLRHEPIALLELGVWKGSSLRMWGDYFTHPDAQIVGVDINPDFCSDDPRVTVFAGDQTSIPAELQKWRPNIIIDDASHLSSKTIDSFKAWFPALTPAGYYVVEDLHTSYLYSGAEANRNPDLPPPARLDGQTAMQFLKRLADEVQAGLVLVKENPAMLDGVEHTAIEVETPHGSVLGVEVIPQKHRLPYGVCEVHFFPKLCVVRKNF